MGAPVWALPIAELWHEQRIEQTIVGAYVRLATSKPEHASCLKLMTELGLTPASLQRLRLIVEAPGGGVRASSRPLRGRLGSRVGGVPCSAVRARPMSR